jgi:hypothetical protein
MESPLLFIDKPIQVEEMTSLIGAKTVILGMIISIPTGELNQEVMGMILIFNSAEPMMNVAPRRPYARESVIRSDRRYASRSRLPDTVKIPSFTGKED